MAAEIIVLRLVHVLGAIIWVGTSLFMGMFLMPALATVGPAGGAIVGALAKRKLFTILPTVAALTMLAGLRLMMIASAGDWGAYFGTRGGTTYLVGAVCALAAFVIFMSVAHPSLHRVMALGPRIAQATETEREALTAELNALKAKGGKAGAISALLLLTTAVAMAIGRYM